MYTREAGLVCTSGLSLPPSLVYAKASRIVYGYYVWADEHQGSVRIVWRFIVGIGRIDKHPSCRFPRHDPLLCSRANERTRFPQNIIDSFRFECWDVSTITYNARIAELTDESTFIDLCALSLTTWLYRGNQLQSVFAFYNFHLLSRIDPPKVIDICTCKLTVNGDITAVLKE